MDFIVFHWVPLSFTGSDGFFFVTGFYRVLRGRVDPKREATGCASVFLPRRFLLCWIVLVLFLTYSPSIFPFIFFHFLFFLLVVFLLFSRSLALAPPLTRIDVLGATAAFLPSFSFSFSPIEFPSSNLPFYLMLPVFTGFYEVPSSFYWVSPAFT